MIYSKFFKGLLVLGLFTVAIQAQAAMVSFDQPSYSIKQGDIFTVSIMGSFSAQEILDGGGLSLNFDSTMFSANSVTINTALFEFFPEPGTIDNVTGKISDMGFNTFTYNAVGNIKIADISFTALKLGNSSGLILTESMLNPFASGGAALNVTLNNSFVTVSAVPIPGAFILMLSSFMFFMPFFKRRKSLILV